MPLVPAALLMLRFFMSHPRMMVFEMAVYTLVRTSGRFYCRFRLFMQAPEIVPDARINSAASRYRDQQLQQEFLGHCAFPQPGGGARCTSRTTNSTLTASNVPQKAKSP